MLCGFKALHRFNSQLLLEKSILLVHIHVYDLCPYTCIDTYGMWTILLPAVTLRGSISTKMPLPCHCCWCAKNSLLNDIPEMITRLKMDWQIATDGNCILKSICASVYLIKRPLDNIMVYLIFFPKAYKLH